MEEPGILSCPDCRRGATIRRVPSSRSTPPEQKETEIFCKYCINALIPAAKTCLLCEASLCEDHLRVHSKSEDHLIVLPTSSMNQRRCPEHRKVLKYFCCEDEMCVCVDCCQTGDHRGHETETLNEAFQKKKRNLKILLEQLTTTKEEAEKRGRDLQEGWKAEKDKVAGEKERVTALFRDIRRQLEDLEKRLLMEVSRLENQTSQTVSDMIQQLEVQKDELSKKMRLIEDLCEATDPLSVLREAKPQIDDISEYVDHAGTGRQINENLFPPIRKSVNGLVSLTLHKRLTGIITQTTKRKGFFLEEVSDLKLDEKASARDLEISADQKTASWLSVKPVKLRKSLRKKNKQMFECSQVLSTRSFSSGRQYWEVETGDEGGVRLGVTYANVIRKGIKFHVGENEKSWCLRVWYKNYSAIYDRQIIPLNRKVESNKVGVFLDYQAGQLSFYELASSIRHLHTFTANFTEPLYAAFWVYNSWVKVTS